MTKAAFLILSFAGLSTASADTAPAADVPAPTAPAADATAPRIGAVVSTSKLGAMVIGGVQVDVVVALEHLGSPGDDALGADAAFGPVMSITEAGVEKVITRGSCVDAVWPCPHRGDGLPGYLNTYATSSACCPIGRAIVISSSRRATGSARALVSSPRLSTARPAG